MGKNYMGNFNSDNTYQEQPFLFPIKRNGYNS